MLYKYLPPFFFLLLCSPQTISAQYLYGQVTDMQGTALPGAVVAWAGTGTGARTDDKGEFALPFPADTTQKPLRLAAIYSALRDTFLIDDLHSYWTVPLSATVTLKEVMVRDDATGAYISVLQPVKTEIINRAELRKAACCDLAGCFETQATVQPTTTNILTNAKELRILGLSGVYNQVLVDGLPTIQGLTYTYGTGTIPGSMLENIWVVKGANSVLQGYEGMVGQITIFPREGGLAEPLTADVLLNSFGEKHLNMAVATNKTRWTNYLALHTSQPGGKWDRDGDTFLDLPRLTRYSLYNKWRYRKENEKGLSAFLAARLVQERRIGGQVDFNPQTDEGSTRAYGQTLRFWQPELLTKTGWRFDENRKISLLASFVAQDQQAWPGLTERLWIHPDVVQTHKNASMADPWRARTEAERAHGQAEVEALYREFVALVARARKKTEGEVDALAQGRVWIGSDAHAHGLLDGLGGLEEALDRAKTAAGGRFAEQPALVRAKKPRPRPAPPEAEAKKAELLLALGASAIGELLDPRVRSLVLEALALRAAAPYATAWAWTPLGE